MEPVVRAVPISSREDAATLLQDINDYPNDAGKQEFADAFEGTVEHWYYQELEGKPYLIAVALGGNAERGYSQYKNSQLPFFAWFRDQIAKLSGVDLRDNPKGVDSEYLGCMK